MQQLLGRDDELLAIQDALQEAASGFGRTIILSGIAGTGKSEVLKAGARLAAEQGLLILRGGGALSDGELDFAPLLRVAGADFIRWSLGPDRIQDSLNDRAESNRRLRSLDAESIAWSLDKCLADLASQQPVLLVLDDVQWFDEQSLQWLSNLPWRVASQRVVVLVAMSDSEVCSNVALLDNLREGADAEFRLSNLDRNQVSMVLAKICRSDPATPFVDACDAVTAGNPGFVTALARALAELGSQLENASDIQKARLSALGHSLRARLRRCTRHGLEIVEAFAILGDRANLSRVAEMVGSGASEIESEVYALVRAGWLTGRDEQFRCAFPIMGPALIGEIDRVHLLDRRVSAARVVANDSGAPRDVADLLMPAHWAGEPWARAALSAAAHDAVLMGDPYAALRYYECAIGDQQSGADQTDLLIDSGAILARLDIRASADRLEQAAEGELTATQKQRINETLAEVDDCLDRRRSGHDDRSAVPSTTDTAFSSSCQDGAPRSPTLLRPWTEPFDRSRRATLESWFGPSVDAPIAAAKAMVAESPLTSRNLRSHLRALTLMLDCGELDTVSLYLDRTVEAARHWQDRPSEAIAISLRSAVRRELGMLNGAMEDSSAGIALLAECHAEAGSIQSTSARARYIHVLVDHGFIAKATTFAGADTESDDHTEADTIHGLQVQLARARVMAAAGQADDALHTLMRCGDFAVQGGVTNPRVLPWRSEAATILASSGRLDEAAALAKSEVDDARTFRNMAALGRALRVQGAIVGGSRGRAILEESIQILTGTPFRVELTRSLVAYGSILAEIGETESAKAVLRDAAPHAYEYGLQPLIDGLVAAYTRAGGRLSKNHIPGIDLTKAELRVAELAAQGRTNAEIAGKLFIGRRTVEIHLSNSYRKLRLVGRDGLRNALRRYSFSHRPGEERDRCTCAPAKIEPCTC
jgi:DNA-binding CsgD family transcriptional regulator